MIKYKYLLIIALILFVYNKSEALDINYSTIIDKNNTHILVEYNKIEAKERYLCNVNTFVCTKTTKETISKSKPSSISTTLRRELYNKGANHLTLSNTSKWVAYYIRNKEGRDTRTFGIKDVKTKKEYTQTKTSTYWDLVSEQARVYAFSPNDKKLIYTDDTDGAFALYIVDTTRLKTEGWNSTKINTSALQVDDFIFTDNDTIYYIGNDKSNPYMWSLYRYDLSRKEETVLDTMVSYSDPLVKIGSNIIYNHLQEDGYSPKAYNVKTKAIKQFQTPYIKQNTNILKQEIIKHDTIKGVIMKPDPDTFARSYPLVIWLHGGPYRQTSYGYHPFHSYGTYDSILELLRKNDVMVLKLDYRGSFGFGRTYSEGIKNTVGIGDTEDIMTAITYTKNKYGVTDVYLMGNSYGGYMALRALVEHPSAFAGVVSINGVTDWEKLLNDMQTSIFNVHFNGAPNEANKDLYKKASILDKVDNIKKQRISIISGVSDRTIPYTQATLMYDKLKEEKKKVELVAYVGEDHVYKRKDTIQDLCKQLFTFVKVPVDEGCNK